MRRSITGEVSMDRIEITTWSDTERKFINTWESSVTDYDAMVEGTAVPYPYLGRMRCVMWLECEYCGMKILSNAFKCEHCGAPVRTL